MRYVFGPFELDTSKLELRRDGEPVSIEPQVFEMLTHLIKHRDRVLSKDDLIEIVWGGRVVSDAAISSRIKLVRRAVDDDGTRQSVIKTFHGKGFRFVAEVTESTEAKPIPDAVIEPSRPANQNRKLGVQIALAASVVLSVIVLLQLITNSTQSAAPRIAVLPVINETGDSDLDWVELGLMSLVSRELDVRSELSLVSDRTMVNLSDRFPAIDGKTFSPHEKMNRALQEGYGASHVLISRLTGSADNLSLEYRMINPRGKSSPRTVSSQPPADLAKEMSRQIAASLPRSGERRLDVPTEMFEDAYIAETFARGREQQLKGKGSDSADLFRVAAAQVPDNLEVKYQLAVSTRMAGDLDGAEAQLRTLIAMSVASGDIESEANATNGLGVVHMRRRQDAEALETYRKALAIIDGATYPEIRAKILSNIGIVERRLGNLVAAEEALGRALIEYEAAGYEMPPGSLLNSMANLKTLARDIPTANTYYQQALDYSRLVGDRRSEAVILHNLGTNAATVGDYDRAYTLLTNGLALRRELSDHRGQISSLSGLAQLALNRGSAPDASKHSDEMTRLAREANDQYRIARAEELAAHIDMVLADWDAALMHSQSAQTIYESLSRTRNAHRERIRQAAITGYRGSTEGRQTVEDALDWALAENQQGTQLHAYEALTVLNLLDGDDARAAQTIDAAVNLSADMQLKATNGRLAARQGLIRLLNANPDGAKASLGRAKTGNPDHQETRFLEGLLRLQDGKAELGAKLITDAVQSAGDNWHLTERLFPSLKTGS